MKKWARPVTIDKKKGRGFQFTREAFERAIRVMFKDSSFTIKYDAGATKYDAGATKYDAGATKYDAGATKYLAPTLTLTLTLSPKKK